MSGEVFAQGVGDTAPDFTLNTLDGGTFTLSDHEGKVVLIFFFGYGCPSCLQYGPSIQEELVEAYSGNENYIAVGLDVWDGNESSVQTFRNSTGLTIPLCLMASSVASSYGTSYDKLFVIDPEGKIAFKGANTAGPEIGNAMSVIDEQLSGIVTGISNHNDQQFNVNIYPNPAISDINVSFTLTESTNVGIDLLSVDGKKVLSVRGELYQQGKNIVNLQTNNLPEGIYFVAITMDRIRTLYKLILR